MLFLNELYPQLAQLKFGIDPAGINNYDAAIWLLPVFLFIVGLSIPYSINKRISDGEDAKSIARHIFTRTIGLFVIGLVMVNSSRVNSEFTGMGKNLWTLLMLVGVFLIWNNYQEKENNFFTIAGLRLAGIAIMIALVYKFQSGLFENNGSLITGWWGYTGVIGWGYLVTALIYLAIRDRIFIQSLAAFFFFILTVLANLKFFTSLDSFKPIFGVISEGNVPLMIMLGIIISTITAKEGSRTILRKIVTIVTIGIFIIIAGYYVQWQMRWFRQLPMPGWILVRTGINALIFAIIYWLSEIKGVHKKAGLILTLGRYSLTVYLTSILVYHLVMATRIPLFFYEKSDSVVVLIMGSLIWTLLIIGLTRVLHTYGIKLKL